MRELWLLLSVTARGWRNALLRPATRRRSLPGGGGLVLLLLTGAVAYGTFRLLLLAGEAFAFSPGLVNLARAALVTNAALGAFLFMFMLGVRDVYDSLYQSPDLAFLLSAPLRPSAVYLARLLGTAGVSLAAALPMGLGVVLGAGAASGAPLWYYPAALLALALAALLFCTAASLLILPFMRWLPARRLRQGLLSLSLLATLAFVFLTQWASTWGGSKAWADPARVASRLLVTSRVGWLPHGWLAQAWLGPLEGHPEALGFGLLALGLGAAVLAALSWWASGRVWVQGWEGGQGVEAGPGAPARPQPVPPRARPRLPWLRRQSGTPAPAAAPAALATPVAGSLPRVSAPSPLWTLAFTELRLFSREPMAWYGLGVAAVVSGFLAYSLSRQQPTDLGGLPHAAFVFTVLLVVAGSWSRLRLVPMSPRDPAFWVVRCSPVEPRRLYWSKFLALFLPALALVAALYLGCSLIFGMGLDLLASLMLAGPVLAAVASVSLWLEIRFPGLAGPRGGRVPGGSRSGSLLGSLISMLAAVVVMAAAAAPWLGWVVPASRPFSEALGLAAGWLLPVIVAGVVAWLAAWDGTRQLDGICRGREA